MTLHKGHLDLCIIGAAVIPLTGGFGLSLVPFFGISNRFINGFCKSSKCEMDSG